MPNQNHNIINGQILPIACSSLTTIVAGTNLTAYRNDTFGKIRFALIVNEIIKDLADTVITMQIRYKEPTGTLLYEATGGNGITVTDAAAGLFTIDSFIVNIPSGKHVYDIQFDDNSVNSFGKRTFIRGYFTVIEDITK